jgi:serine/threonine protein kinase
VLKGTYPRIPPSFSSDLSSMLKSLLQVDPQNRATIKQILHKPIQLSERCNELREEKAKEFDI